MPLAQQKLSFGPPKRTSDAASSSSTAAPKRPKPADAPVSAVTSTTSHTAPSLVEQDDPVRRALPLEPDAASSDDDDEDAQLILEAQQRARARAAGASVPAPAPLAADAAAAAPPAPAPPASAAPPLADAHDAAAAVVAAAAAAAETAPPAIAGASNLSEYEIQRLQNIRRNHEILHSLGLADDPLIEDRPPRPPPKPRERRQPPPPPPTTRTLRARTAGGTVAGGAGPSSDAGDGDGRAAAAAEREAEAARAAEREYYDSGIVQYTAGAAASSDGADAESSGGGGGGRLVGWRRAEQPPLVVQSKKGVYGLSIARGGGVLAAGGGDGMAAIFAFGDGAAAEAADDDDDDDGAAAPLIEWKAHGGWVCDVQFVSGGGDGDGGGGGLPGLPLLSASNAGDMKLWDASQAFGDRRSRHAHHGGAKELAVCQPHRHGVWCLHELGGSIATASKDGTVAISELTSAGLRAAVRSFDDPQGHVVKSARWRDAHTVLAAGNGGHLNVFDARAAGRAAALSIEASSFALNTVLCSPRDSHVALVNGFEPVARLYDVRQPGTALHELKGHSLPLGGRVKKVHQPIFCAGGALVALVGDRGTGQLSLAHYSVATGAAAGFDALGTDYFYTPQDVGTTLGVVPPGGRRADERVVISRGRELHVFEPRWG